MTTAVSKPAVRSVNATVTEAATYSGISRSKLYEHYYAGDIKAVRFGRSIRFAWSEVERFAREGTAAE